MPRTTVPTTKELLAQALQDIKQNPVLCIQLLGIFAFASWLANRTTGNNLKESFLVIFFSFISITLIYLGQFFWVRYVAHQDKSIKKLSDLHLLWKYLLFGSKVFAIFFGAACALFALIAAVYIISALLRIFSGSASSFFANFGSSFVWVAAIMGAVCFFYAHLRISFTFPARALGHLYSLRETWGLAKPWLKKIFYVYLTLFSIGLLLAMPNLYLHFTGVKLVVADSQPLSMQLMIYMLISINTIVSFGIWLLSTGAITRLYLCAMQDWPPPKTRLETNTVTKPVVSRISMTKSANQTAADLSQYGTAQPFFPRDKPRFEPTQRFESTDYQSQSDEKKP